MQAPEWLGIVLVVLLLILISIVLTIIIVYGTMSLIWNKIKSKDADLAIYEEGQAKDYNDRFRSYEASYKEKHKNR